MPASGSRAAPLRGLALHLYNLFVHPGFQGVTLLACGGIFYCNQTTLKPLYLQKTEAQGTSNSLLVEKNKLVKMMPGVRIEDLNRQMEAQKSKLVQNENQVNVECKKISKEMEDLEWLGEVTPQAAVQSFPQIQFLKHFPIEVVLKSPPEIAEKIEEKDATRLFQFLRQVEKTKKLHFLRKLEIQADPKAGWTVKMEYDFFMIQEVPGG